MIQVQTIDDSLPNDPVEIHPESLLEKAVIQIGVQCVFYIVE
jgi:hypothetical protein